LAILSVVDKSQPLWRHWAETRTDSAVALLSTSRHYSWAELNDVVLTYSDSFRQQGVVVGDVITIVGKNTPLSVLLFLATLELGAMVAFIAPQSKSQLLNKFNTLYAKNQSVWLVDLNGDIDIELLKKERKYIQQLNIEDTSMSSSPIQRYSDQDSYDPDSIASLIFTSGSTGLPKAVAHTSTQHLSSSQGLLQQLLFGMNDCWLLSLPLYHVSGLSIIYRWLFAGGTLKVGTGDLCHDMTGVTHASLVATQLQRLLDTNIDLQLTHVLLGGSHIPVTLSDAASALGIETWVGYGMTEAASTVTAKQVNGAIGVGSVLPNRKIKIVDGRIFIAGHTLASGYYWQGVILPLQNDSGWFDSKDLGEWHQNELIIKGRVDNLFISGGENVHCEEIESALLKHPDIQQVIVVPVHDNEFGERPIALVKVAKEVNGQKYAFWLHGKLEKFKWPMHYFPLPESLLKQGIKIPRSLVKQWMKTEHPEFTITL